jgi:trigger factor
MCRKACGFKSRLPHKFINIDKEFTLKIETQDRDDNQVVVEVELDPEKMEGARRVAARKISQRMKIPGFRPGKAPYEVVVRNVGESSITEDAIELLVDQIYPKILEETGIKPAAPGTLEEVVTIDPPKFKFIIPLIPSVDLGDYRSVRMDYQWTPPTEDKVKEAIEELRRMYSSTEAVDRPVQPGDFIMVDIKGVVEENILTEKKGHPIFINPDLKDEEWPYKGFGKKLIGMKPEQEKKLKHKFPKNFQDEEFAGKEVEFNVKVTTVRGMILPELNDEFATKVGNFENVQAMRDAIEANLSNQSKAEYDDEYFENLIEKIKEQSNIKYPPQVLDHEKEHVIHDLERRLSEQNLELDVYLKMREMDKEKFMEEEVNPVAAKRLERALVMDQIAKLEKLEVSEENLSSAFQQTLFEVQNDEQFQKLVKKKKPSQQLMESLAQESANRAMISLTLDRLKKIAMGEITESPKEKPKSKKKGSSKTTDKEIKKEDSILKNEAENDSDDSTNKIMESMRGENE